MSFSGRWAVRLFFFCGCKSASLRAFAVAVALGLAAPAFGQSAAQSPPPESAAEALDTEELQGLVDTLKDDQARAKFVEQLETLLKARQAVEGTGAGEAEAATWLSSTAS